MASKFYKVGELEWSSTNPAILTISEFFWIF